MTSRALLVVAAAAAAACGPLPPLAVPEAPQRERLAALAGPVEILHRSTVLSLATESVVWRGLRVAEPERCGPYLRSHYTVPGAWPVPRLPLGRDRFSDVVSCQPFRSPADVALDRVVLPEVAHDAGFCARSEVERLAFAADPDNWFYGDLEVLRLGPPWPRACGLAPYPQCVLVRADPAPSPPALRPHDPVGGCRGARFRSLPVRRPRPSSGMRRAADVSRWAVGLHRTAVRPSFRSSDRSLSLSHRTRDPWLPPRSTSSTCGTQLAASRTCVMIPT